MAETPPIPSFGMPLYGQKDGASTSYDLQKGFNTVALSMRDNVFQTNDKLDIEQVSGMIDALAPFAIHIDNPHFLKSYQDICKTFEELKSAN